MLEKFNLQKDTIVNAYNLSNNPELCALERRHISEIEEDKKTLDPELLDKFEIQDLSDDIKLELSKLLQGYKHIFDWDNNTMGHTNLIQHKIILEKDTMPIRHRPYRLSPIEADYLQKELDKYCKLGIISPSNSPWAAPVILVKKKNGDYRMVIDYRK
ncbi:hypothetical protein G6F55_013770 [Rhizopus delemar]|nr:hypothetical protein G6F55_013770 [Rhizopus delemar]KAG1529763.1 hypothetical protein G6F51_014046 [Rhizopus arrhizus]KAG1533132.1 hypothetical protein G6F50_015971 [Rhizopus delemar]KAG1607762.1 hypothetical protein G6F45_013710 [Rhizopus arrhizus]